MTRLRPPRFKRPATTTVGVVLLVIGLTACGVTGESAPTAFEVAAEPVAPVAPTDATQAGEPHRLYLVADHGVVPVQRPVSDPAGPGELLTALLSGPTPAESAVGLRTSIPSGTTVLDIAESGGVVAVDLSRQFAAVGGEEEILAVAQIVLSLSGDQGAHAVTFLLDGAPIAVPRPEGSLVDEPVTFVDYDVLLPVG